MRGERARGWTRRNSNMRYKVTQSLRDQFLGAWGAALELQIRPPGECYVRSWYVDTTPSRGSLNEAQRHHSSEMARTRERKRYGVIRGPDHLQRRSMHGAGPGPALALYTWSRRRLTSTHNDEKHDPRVRSNTAAFRRKIPDPRCSRTSDRSQPTRLRGL